MTLKKARRVEVGILEYALERPIGACGNVVFLKEGEPNFVSFIAKTVLYKRIKFVNIGRSGLARIKFLIIDEVRLVD